MGLSSLRVWETVRWSLGIANFRFFESVSPTGQEFEITMQISQTQILIGKMEIVLEKCGKRKHDSESLIETFTFSFFPNLFRFFVFAFVGVRKCVFMLTLGTRLHQNNFKVTCQRLNISSKKVEATEIQLCQYTIIRYHDC